MLKYGTQLPPAYRNSKRSAATTTSLVVIATGLSGGFRYSVRIGSEDHVQMDGGRAGRFLLLPAGNFCSLANCGGDIRHTI